MRLGVQKKPGEGGYPAAAEVWGRNVEGDHRSPASFARAAVLVEIEDAAFRAD